jgi:hypothetical protein
MQAMLEENITVSRGGKLPAPPSLPFVGFLFGPQYSPQNPEHVFFLILSFFSTTSFKKVYYTIPKQGEGGGAGNNRMLRSIMK